MNHSEEFQPEQTHPSSDIPPQYQHNFFPVQEKPAISDVGQFALLLGLTGAGLIIGSIFSVLVFKIMTGAGLTNLPQAMQNPANIAAIKVVQILSTVVMFLFPAVMFATIAHKKPLQYLRFNTQFNVKQIALVVLIALAGLYTSGALAELNARIPISKALEMKFKLLEDEYNSQVLLIAKMNNVREFLVALFVIALLPAIVEEAFFRGALQQIFTNWFKNAAWAIGITSIIFSAIHMSYYGFLPRAALGVVLGLLFYYSKNIWMNIFAHFLNNAVAVAQLYWLSIHGKLTKDAMDDKFPLWYGIIGMTLLVALLAAFKKESTVVLATNDTKTTNY